MDDTFIERLRQALVPDFEVEQVLKGGGMGIVVRAREVALRRSVAVKTIRPELATAVNVERFLREARTLAKLSHQHIVPIHSLHERDGLLCIVMEYIPDDTLEERLHRGVLAPGDVVRLARDILAALEFAHGRGVIHRDIKPSNIFLTPGRALLADFGIAKALGPEVEAITRTGSRLMTVAYASPEQLAGGEPGPASDLYSLSAVLYEALTGRMWCESGGIDDTLAADWRGVPARLAAVLQRGLTFAPADRWPSAAAFAQALWVRRRTSRRRAVVSVLVAVLLAATGKVWWPWVRGLILTPAPAIPDVSFGTCAPDDPGARLRMVAYDVLRNADGVSLARLIDDDGASPNTAKHVVSCKVEQVDGGLRVALKVGTQDREVSGRSDEFEWNLGQRIALEILQVVKPEAFLAPACKPRSVESYNAFMQGQEAFRRDDWSVAIERFEEALGRDPEYCLAEVRLWLAQRWSRRPITVDLAHLLGHHAANLAKEDSLLIAAELAPTRQRRWALYAEATSKNLFGAVAPLQYGGDLTHRGPLDGIPLDRGVAVLREARQRDPKLASIHDQLMWALVRAGHRDSAHAALQALLANAQSARDVDPSVFALIWAMRFQPMDSVLPGLVGAGQGAQQQMAQRVRLALSFDLAPYQVVIGRQLVDAAEASVDERAHGRVAAALGLMALGRPLAGIALLDSAVATGPPDGGILATQVAMWRVLAASLGIDGVPDKDVESARSTLTLLARDSVLGGRAAWALALDAARRGDTSAARTLIAGIPPRDSALRAIAAAVGVGVRLPAQALALTARWRGVREETWRGVDEESSHLSEPFARAILHLRRADWYDATNEPELAERERRWHENSDFAGWLQGPIQAAEVDWVTGAYVRAREGARRVAAGDGDACADLRRVIDTLWAQAEPGVSVLRDEARAKAQVCS